VSIVSLSSIKVLTPTQHIAMMTKNVMLALVLVIGAFVAVDAQTKIITVTNGVQAPGAVWGNTHDVLMYITSNCISS